MLTFRVIKASCRPELSSLIDCREQGCIGMGEKMMLHVLVFTGEYFGEFEAGHAADGCDHVLADMVAEFTHPANHK